MFTDPRITLNSKNDQMISLQTEDIEKILDEEDSVNQIKEKNEFRKEEEP